MHNNKAMKSTSALSDARLKGGSISFAKLVCIPHHVIDLLWKQKEIVFQETTCFILTLDPAKGCRDR